MSKIGIVGYGSIGNNLATVYRKHKDFASSVYIVDPKFNCNDDIRNCDVLNICIPFTEDFVNTVNTYISENTPKITVIHSTVAPGTTSKIIGNTCHSPVRGLHPDLDTGIKLFLKYIGADDRSVAKQYQEHLNCLNIKSLICKNSKTTEYAKLLDTTYYGICIAFHNDVLKLCEAEGLNFEEVMTTYNLTYNEGYSALGKKNVARPVLYGSKKIGGHCVVPNAKILKNFLDIESIQSIIRYE